MNRLTNEHLAVLSAAKNTLTKAFSYITVKLNNTRNRMKKPHRMIVALCMALLLAVAWSTDCLTTSGFLTVNAQGRIKEVPLPKVKVPTPATSGYIETYTIKNSGRVNSPDSTAWIAAYEDRCRIVGINSNGTVKVSFPTSNGRLIRNFNLSDFTTANLKNGTFDTYRVTKNFTCYRRKDKKQTFGSAYKNDVIYVLAESGGMIQIIYPITDGTANNCWRMCWTPKSNMSYMVKIVSRIDFINKEKAEWFTLAENAKRTITSAYKTSIDVVSSKAVLTALGGITGTVGAAYLGVTPKPSLDPEIKVGIFQIIICKFAVSYAIKCIDKVLSYRNVTMTNDRCIEMATAYRDMCAFTQLVYKLYGPILDEYASLAGKSAAVQAVALSKYFLDGAYNSYTSGIGNISKTAESLMKLSEKAGNWEKFFAGSAIYFNAFEHYDRAYQTGNNIINNLKNMP